MQLQAASYGPSNLPPREIGQPIVLVDDCPAMRGDEILVCSRPKDNDRYRIGRSPPPPPTGMDALSQRLRFHIGPVEIGALGNASGKVGIGIRVRF